jgi:hypothetical protein
MRYITLVLAVALVAGTAEARADLVTFNMTGTIDDTRAYIYTRGQDGWGHIQNYSHPFAAGDPISWTLQYDLSTPPTPPYNQSPGTYGLYEMQPGKLVLTNIVDQTTGYHFPVPPPGTDTGSNLTLSRYPGLDNEHSHFSFQANQGSWRGWGFNNGDATQSVWLALNTTSPLPALGLASLDLTKIPFAFGEHGLVGSFFQLGTYKFGPNNSEDVSQFSAHVDSITVSTASTPEPGSLTLFLLGVAGLTARGMRRRMGQVG